MRGARFCKDNKDLPIISRKFNKKRRSWNFKGVFKSFLRPFCVLCNGGNRQEARQCRDRKCPLHRWRYVDFGDIR